MNDVVDFNSQQNFIKSQNHEKACNSDFESSVMKNVADLYVQSIYYLKDVLSEQWSEREKIATFKT